MVNWVSYFLSDKLLTMLLEIRLLVPKPLKHSLDCSLCSPHSHLPVNRCLVSCCPYVCSVPIRTSPCTVTQAGTICGHRGLLLSPLGSWEPAHQVTHTSRSTGLASSLQVFSDDFLNESGLCVIQSEPLFLHLFQLLPHLNLSFSEIYLLIFL